METTNRPTSTCSDSRRRSPWPTRRGWRSTRWRTPTHDAFFADGEDANTHSDVYTLSTLLFAMVLFFAAISERFEVLPVRLTLLAIAAVGLVDGLVIALGQPITSG